MMTSFRTDKESKARRATLQARKIAQADEGRTAMADYQREQAATLARTAKLRAQRLAKEAEAYCHTADEADGVRKKKSA